MKIDPTQVRPTATRRVGAAQSANGSGFAAALLAALVVGLVNATFGLVLKILTFPLTIVTLGIFWIVINALMLMLAASFVPGFSIQGFLPAFIGAIVLSLVNLVLRKIKRELREEQE